VKPHEKILAKSKVDKLKLLKATKANISSGFCLFEDEKLVITNICRKIAKRDSSVTARDKEGMFHKLWIVNDDNIIKAVKNIYQTKNL
jgi:uncharacterized protein (DUF1015 family)